MKVSNPMSNLVTRTLVVAVCIFSLSAAPTTRSATQPSERYRVKLDRIVLDRPVRCWGTLRFTREMKSGVSGGKESTRNQEQTVEFEGVQTYTDAVDGQANKIVIAVDRFEKIDDGKRVVIVPPGSKLIATRNPDETIIENVYTLDGKPTPEDQQYYFRQIASLDPIKDYPSDDDVYGVAEPQPLGATWPVKSDVMLHRLKRNEYAVDRAKSAGQMRLINHVEHDGIACLQIEGESKIENAFSKQIPADAKSVELIHAFAILAPLDVSQPIVRSTIVSDMSIHFERTTGSGVSAQRWTADDHGTRTSEWRFKAE